jgi:hypothetical protein
MVYFREGLHLRMSKSANLPFPIKAQLDNEGELVDAEE